LYQAGSIFTLLIFFAFYVTVSAFHAQEAEEEVARAASFAIHDERDHIFSSTRPDAFQAYIATSRLNFNQGKLKLVESKERTEA
jgi:hypothetical protein